MSNPRPNKYLIVEFDWPKVEKPEMYKAAGNLHRALEEADWIEEVFAGFGGIGAGKSSIWVFKIAKYANLDELNDSYNPDQNEVSKAYSEFFKMMINVEEKIREEALFV